MTGSDFSETIDMTVGRAMRTRRVLLTLFSEILLPTIPFKMNAFKIFADRDAIFCLTI